MDGWDIVLLAVAGYLAVTILMRLMVWRRNQLVTELLEQAQREQKKTPTKPEPAQPPRRAA